MTTTITIFTSSTNIESGTTTTTATTLPPEVMGLPRDQRDLSASRIIVKYNKPLENVKDQLATTIGPLLEGKKESTLIKDGPVVNILNISGSNTRVYIQSQDRSANITNITPKEVFEELRKIIEANIQQKSERSELLSKVEELERTRGTKGYVQCYSEFIGLAVNHLVLFTQLLPALTHWLGG